MLVDPTVEEENLCTGILTIVLKGDHLCCFHKPGGDPLSDEELSSCIDKAKTRVPLVTSLLESALNESRNS